MIVTGESLLERLQYTDVAACNWQTAHGPHFSNANDTGDYPSRFEARQIYFALLQDKPDDLAVVRSRYYLTDQLKKVGSCSTDMPLMLSELPSWSAANSRTVGAQYHQYLKQRKEGHDRRYFSNKAHALYFLKSVAPTKLVDGAWLYGVLERWREPRFIPLIQTYLEELGEGVPDKNHVVIYRKLLATHGCQQWTSLDDANFVQGAIQLALAQHTASFLPEVIGYNLGYEQLPLHLLISAYELNELGIDPYYFTLHVTVDNAATGHAMQAVQAVFEALPLVCDKQDFYRRVINGYKLNSLGANTTSIISQFDLDEEVLAVLAAKARVGAGLHSDYCKISGKFVNEWLSDPGLLPEFLDVLQESGWIKRHQSPGNSRFWKLIEGEQAQMFGVFNAYEKQVIHDWIAGDSAETDTRQLSFRAAQRLANSGLDEDCMNNAGTPQGDFDADVHLLQKLASGRDDAMDLIVSLMSPVHHHTEAGLMATRIFTRRF